MPKGGPVFKTLMRMETVARLESLGASDIEISEHVGLSLQGLATLKNKRTYKLTRRRIASGILSDFDSLIVADRGYVTERIKQMVPAALEALYNAATQKGDPKLAVSAATEILDRDGRAAKVSRIGLPTEQQGGFAANKTDLDMAAELARIMQNEQPTATESHDDNAGSTDTSVTVN